MHRHHQHPEEVNEERLEFIKMKRKMWSREEDEHLIVIADAEWKSGMMKKEHLGILQANFSHRTIDSIKKRLQHLRWAPPPAGQQPPTSPPPATGTRQIPPSSVARTHLPPSTSALEGLLPPSPAGTSTSQPRLRGTVWTKGEDDELEKQASRLWKPNMLKKNLAEALSTVTKGRSMEAIRKRLQKLKWVPPGPTSVSGSPAMTPVEGTGSDAEGNREVCSATSRKQPGGGDETTTLKDKEEEWRRTLLNKALETLTEKRIEGDKLRLIAEGMLDGTITREQGAEQLETITQEFAPIKWKSCGKRRGPRKEPRSNKQVRRARYAHVQKLYKLKRKDAAHSVLEGRWREAYRGMDREVKGVFNNKGIKREREVHQRPGLSGDLPH